MSRIDRATSAKARVLIGVCAAVAMVSTLCAPATAVPADGGAVPAATAARSTMPRIVPKPVSLARERGHFTLTKRTTIIASGAARSIGQDLRASLRPATGFRLPVVSRQSHRGDIKITLGDPGTLGADTHGEGYQLDVSTSGVSLKATTMHGLFNGVQTIRQMLPAWIASPSMRPGPWTIRAAHITDFPRYEYRGVMLDIGRHYQTPAAAKKLIDEAAAAKLNTFHLHLSDDQGFRIVIKGFPNLTAIGAQGSVGTAGRTMDPGGFWTQAQFKEVVAYAAARFITVVPEVDTPGHTNAIIMSEYQDTANRLLNGHPEDINCSTAHPPIWNYTGDVGYSALCPSSDNTWTILTSIIKQLSAMASSQYYNIGGDEVPTNVLSQQQYASLVNREGSIVNAQGKTVMGWAEIAGAGTNLAAGSVAEYWNPASGSSSSTASATEAVQKHMKIVMSPANHAYLDQKYAPAVPQTLGLTWACEKGCDVDQFYNWDPSTYVTGVTDANVIGVEGALWSETITNLSEAKYMVFPRLLALAELGWSPKANRTATSGAYQDFLIRLAAQGARLTAGGTNFYPSPEVPWPLEAIAAHPTNKGHGIRHRRVGGMLATLSAPGVVASAITATIDWGDGTKSTGTVSGREATGTTVNGLYTISGSHTYRGRHHNSHPVTSSHRVTITISAPGKAPVTVRVTVRNHR